MIKERKTRLEAKIGCRVLLQSSHFLSMAEGAGFEPTDGN